jgi:uncharacterized NAD(P)/FAD-binding protein YdhS
MEIRSKNGRPSRTTVAIIGGGFSGAILAAQLLLRSRPKVRVVVVEKSSSVGRGLAYGTDCRSLLLNVRARNMSAFADDPHHFLRWAQSNYDPATGPGSFLPRSVYGQYVQCVLNQAAQSAGKLRLEWIKDEAVTLARTGDGATKIQLRSGHSLRADRVVLALGNFPARDPLAFWNAQTNKRYFRNPWSAETFCAVGELNSVLLIGSGLTSVDVAIQLRVEGFRGAIHIVSRRGLLPQPHKLVDACPPFWNESSPKSVRGLLRLVRQEVRQAQRQGVAWQSVFDSLRPQVARIWQSLSGPERRRFLRHVRPYWEVHRHRAAPEIAQSIAGQISSGEIQLHTGRITGYAEDESGMKVDYRERETGKYRSLRVDRIINCTGPECDYRRLENPLVSSLLAQGWASPDRLFLGLDTSVDGALIDRDGSISSSLYAVGPALKASRWESTAVPELREQIYKLVQHLLDAIGAASAPASESIDPSLSESPSDSLLSQA